MRKEWLKENQAPIYFGEWRWGIAVLDNWSEVNAKILKNRRKMPIWWGRMETGKRLDARPDAIEIFGDAYQSITNAVELKEPVSRCFRRFCKYLSDVWRSHWIFGSVSIWCIDMWWNIRKWWASMCWSDAKDVRRSPNSYTAVGNAYGAKCKNIRKFRRNIRILRTYGGRTSARLSTCKYLNVSYTLSTDNYS